MQRRLVIDRDLFAGLDVAQGEKEYVIVKDLHERIGTARVINVVGAVSPTTAIEAPAIVDLTNPEHLSMSSAPGFGV